MAIVEASLEQELVDLNAEKSVLFFWASWHEQSKRGGQLQSIFAALAEKFPSVKFILVEAEMAPALSEKMGVTLVPTFVGMVKTTIVEKVEGINPADLSNLAKKIASISQEEVAKLAPGEKKDEKSELFQRLEKLVNAAPIMLFMKGSSNSPRCGFSRQMVEILNKQEIPFASFDILSDEDVRQGLKTYSDWPTYPQLYVNGSLVGGLDIVKEMEQGGDLKQQLGVEELLNKLAQQGKSIEPKEDPKVTLNKRLEKLINTAPVMLFMKGSSETPRCGFSRQMVEILNNHKISFSSFDILSDEDVRQGLKVYSDWPTYPQLYANGSLVGGLDIVKEMEQGGDLKQQLGI